MIRGTTPTLTFSLPFDVSNATKIWLTFSQNDKEVFTLNKEDLEISENAISCKLSQSQTLSFSEHFSVMIQIRAIIGGKAFASDIMTATVGKILKDGEI